LNQQLICTFKNISHCLEDSVDEYLKLVTYPELQALISNQFLLQIVLSVKPDDTDLSRITRGVLYDRFVEHLMFRAQERLQSIQLEEAYRPVFQQLCDEGFVQHCTMYYQ